MTTTVEVKPTAEQVLAGADSTAYNWNEHQTYARTGEWGAVIPQSGGEIDGEWWPDAGSPDFERATVTPLSEWNNPNF